jgi:hypothetical protein
LTPTATTGAADHCDFVGGLAAATDHVNTTTKEKK